MLMPNIDLKIRPYLSRVVGFIGVNLVTELSKTIEPVSIVGIDNVNDYYDVSIKEYRLLRSKSLLSKSSQAAGHL